MHYITSTIELPFVVTYLQRKHPTTPTAVSQSAQIAAGSGNSKATSCISQYNSCAICPSCICCWEGADGFKRTRMPNVHKSPDIGKPFYIMVHACMLPKRSIPGPLPVNARGCNERVEVDRSMAASWEYRNTNTVVDNVKCLFFCHC